MLRFRILVFFLCVFTSFFPLAALADSDLPGVEARLLSSLDSLPVAGGTCVIAVEATGRVVETRQWGVDGRFSCSFLSSGRYVFTFSSPGYEPLVKRLAVDSLVQLGDLYLRDNMIRLKIATVKGRATLQIVRGDTVIYNPAALNLSPDATLKDMVKKIPGMALKDGKLTWNGKDIDRILVNGQEFFGDNKGLALDHLATVDVAGVKVYDKASEFTEKTGVEDGARETVMDVILKKDRKGRWLGDVHLGGGTEEQYEVGGFATRFTDRVRTSVLAETTTRTPTAVDLATGNPSGTLWQAGHNHNQQYAGEFAWNNGRPAEKAGALDLNAHLAYTALDGQTRSQRDEQTFLPEAAPVFSLTDSRGRAKNRQLDASARLKWQMDSLTYFSVYARYRRGRTRQSSQRRSAVFTVSPYDVVADSPLDALFASSVPAALAAATTNSDRRTGLTDDLRPEWTAQVLMLRKLAKPGRSLTVQGTYSGSRDREERHSLADIRYPAAGGAGEVNRQYLPGRGENFSAVFLARYTEPLTSALSLMATYTYTRKRERGDRPLFRLDSLGGDWASAACPPGQLPPAGLWQQVMDRRNSVFSTRNEWNHAAEARLSYTARGWRATAGVALRPERTDLRYRRDAIDTTVVRRLCYVSPSFTLNKSFGGKWTLDAKYSAKESYPELVNLLDYTDDSDPLNVTRGNPGLRPSWEHRGMATLRFFDPETQLFVNHLLSFSATSNAVSQALHYDAATGVRTLRPENVDGNFSFNYGAVSTVYFKRNQAFHIDPAATFKYQRYSSLVSRDGLSSQEARMNAWLTALSLGAGYDEGETSLSLTLEWDCERMHNLFRPDERELHHTVYLFSTQSFLLPGKIRFDSDMTFTWNRGYGLAPMNYSEYSWTLNLSRTFLPADRLTLKLTYYDVLNSVKSNQYGMGAYSAFYTHTDYVHSFFMLTLRYRL